MALPFVNTKKIKDAYKAIKELMPSKLKKLATWFEKNYLGRRYPPSFWNVAKFLRKNLPRTTNNAESYHKRINKILGKNTCSIPKLINAFKDECERAEEILDDVEYNNKWPIRQKKRTS